MTHYGVVHDATLPTLPLADGAAYSGFAYTGWVRWHDSVSEIEVISVDADPLVGMKLLAGSNLSIDAEPGGTVVITELPAAV